MITQTDRSIRPAQRTEGIRYAIRDIVELAHAVARTGKPMLYLNIGDPNVYGFEPPPHILEPVIRAMQDNHNGYGPSSGVPEAVEAIRHQAARQGIRAIQHVYVTHGSSEGIDLALSALVDRGDNVLTPCPGYPFYDAVLARLEVENRPYQLDEDRGWEPDVDDIAERIDPRTRALVVINPNNPTGGVCSRRTMERIVELAIRHNLVLFSDEIYDRLTFDGAAHVCPAALSSEAKVITFNGLSKAFLVPGLRIGWGVVSGPAAELAAYCEAIRKMERARLCANHPAQYAIRAALDGPQTHVADLVRRLTRQRDAALAAIRGIPGLSCVKPGGAMYAFPRIDFDADDHEFVVRVLRETGVVLVPGSGFGQRPGTQHFRIVILPAEETLRDAFGRIARMVASHPPTRAST